MMSGHGANPIFFNKKIIKIGRPEHSLPPLAPYSPTHDNISFLPYKPHTPRSFKVDVICVSPLN